MDIRLHDGGIHPHSFSRYNLVFHGDLDHAPMQIRDYVRSYNLTQPPQSLRIRHLLRANAGERAVDQIGADFPLQHFVAPGADMLSG